ncbi:hypothetical protein HMPREF1068_00358 [Bacteroides nordii CL02T12C05]|uniref:Uncharacterized protein n=1 Tax=Bacteroides nordii CL02T12C05 TaxID=997884 RepID=I8XUP2_9BACE|nr:hypothetical protein HMPREF1068_00358 [Bacteroides nordii CL02T12C05]
MMYIYLKSTMVLVLKLGDGYKYGKVNLSAMK